MSLQAVHYLSLEVPSIVGMYMHSSPPFYITVMIELSLYILLKNLYICFHVPTAPLSLSIAILFSIPLILPQVIISHLCPCHASQDCLTCPDFCHFQPHYFFFSAVYTSVIFIPSF